MKGRPRLRIAALLLPTLLLAAGWGLASMRERDSLAREQEALLMRTADAVRAAVDESLEELRRREDERPFYLYNHFYSPPELMALTDPIAISPLAATSTDQRIRGYFQVDPGGRVRTPHEPDGALGGASPLGREIASLVGGAGFAEVRELASIDDRRVKTETATQVATAHRKEGKKAAPKNESAVAPRLADSSRTRDRGVDPFEQQQESSDKNMLALAAPQANEEQVGQQQAALPQQADAPVSYGSLSGLRNEPESQYTVSLNSWSNQVYEDIKQVQAEGSSSGLSLGSIGTGRKAPKVSRRTVPWDEKGSKLSSKKKAPPQKAAQKKKAAKKQRSLSLRLENKRALSSTTKGKPKPNPRSKSAPAEKSSRKNLDDDKRLPAKSGKLASTKAPARQGLDERNVGSGERPPPPAREPGLPSETDAVVDYTPMSFVELDESLLLTRTVSHEGVTSVQGVVLDRAHLVRSWVPAVVQRYSVSQPAPRVLAAEDDAEGCELVLPGSELLSDVDLCFDSAGLEVARAGLDNQLYLQGALLAALMLLVLGAALAIERASRRAMELSTQKSAFISAISHELRTPLTTLRMHAEMLRDDLVGEARRPRFYKHMANESVRLGHLVENVLEISRLEEGRRPLRAERTDLAALLRDVVASQTPYAETKGFTLESAGLDEEVDVLCDRQAVEQVVINLLDNAVKYSAESSDKTVRLHLDTRGDRVFIHVLDHGPGIPENERERVFERFHRVRREGQEHVVGTGLGLALVRDLARAHGGDVRVDDRAGGGTDMVVELPLEPTGATS
jgi:signal transduction histidine kinase